MLGTVASAGNLCAVAVKKGYPRRNLTDIELFHLHGYKLKSAILLNRINARDYSKKCEKYLTRLSL